MTSGNASKSIKFPRKMSLLQYGVLECSKPICSLEIVVYDVPKKRYKNA